MGDTCRRSGERLLEHAFEARRSFRNSWKGYVSSYYGSRYHSEADLDRRQRRETRQHNPSPEYMDTEHNTRYAIRLKFSRKGWCHALRVKDERATGLRGGGF